MPEPISPEDAARLDKPNAIRADAYLDQCLASVNVLDHILADLAEPPADDHEPEMYDTGAV